jgi:hypothetical protein
MDFFTFLNFDFQRPLLFRRHRPSEAALAGNIFFCATFRETLIVRDGLGSHRNRMVWELVREQHGRLWLEFLPACAPELNLVEHL